MYEEDFLSEREARESLASEKDMLEHNITRLQQKNKELMRELKLSQDGKGHKMRYSFQILSKPVFIYPNDLSHFMHFSSLFRNNKDMCEEPVSNIFYASYKLLFNKIMLKLCFSNR